jgi:hypothetical protein
MFPAGASAQDLTENSGGSLAAAGLGRPDGGQGDSDVDEQDQHHHPSAEDRQYVNGQRDSDSGDGADRADGSFHEDEDAGWR